MLAQKMVHNFYDYANEESKENYDNFYNSAHEVVCSEDERLKNDYFDGKHRNGPKFFNLKWITALGYVSVWNKFLKKLETKGINPTEIVKSLELHAEMCELNTSPFPEFESTKNFLKDINVYKIKDGILIKEDKDLDLGFEEVR